MTLVVAWGNKYKAKYKCKIQIASDQEETETKALLHARDTTRCGAICIHISSPDTDVVVLQLTQ